MHTIAIDTDDLAEVVERVLPFRSPPEDHRPALQGVLISPARDGLRWITTDSCRMACMHRGASDLAHSVVVPGELLSFAVRHAVHCGLETVTLATDDERDTITLHQPELQVTRPLIDLAYPDVDAHLFAAPAHQPAALSLHGENLRAAIHATVTYSSSTDDDTDRAIALRTENDTTLRILARWPDIPDTTAYIRASSDAPVDTVVNARYLLSLLDAAGSSDLELLVGSESEPLRVHADDGFYGLLMPLHLGQPDLECQIADYLGKDRRDLYVRDDGSIPLLIDDTKLGVRLVPSPDSFGRGNLVRFTCTITENIAETPELLRELNQLNAHANLCRIVHEDHTVYVTADNLLATLDDEAIHNILGQLIHHARTFGPLIRAVHV